MTTLTIWKTQDNKIQVVQLSDDPLDGTDAEQILYLKTLDFYAGLTCVSENYTGIFPDTDSSLWEWIGGKVVSGKSTVPSIVSMRQARLALLQSGLLSIVSAAIAAGAEADQIEWEYAAEVNRNQPLVKNMKLGLKLSDADLDNLFTLAASL